jgi:uncharacterized protein YjbJ (UPF0337 family)
VFFFGSGNAGALTWFWVFHRAPACFGGGDELGPRGTKVEAGRRQIREKWDKLTEDDLKFIDGRRDRLEGRIQQRYGFSPDYVRKEVDDGVRWQAPLTTQRRSRTARLVGLGVAETKIQRI